MKTKWDIIEMSKEMKPVVLLAGIGVCRLLTSVFMLLSRINSLEIQIRALETIVAGVAGSVVGSAIST